MYSFNFFYCIFRFYFPNRIQHSATLISFDYYCYLYDSSCALLIFFIFRKRGRENFYVFAFTSHSLCLITCCRPCHNSRVLFNSVVKSTGNCFYHGLGIMLLNLICATLHSSRITLYRCYSFQLTNFSRVLLVMVAGNFSLHYNT